MGHQDPFPQARPNGRSRFSQGTFTSTNGSGRDAPTPDLGETGWAWCVRSLADILGMRD